MQELHNRFIESAIFNSIFENGLIKNGRQNQLKMLTTNRH